jgi:O-antigen/teichoic acid export membrane protein
VPRRRTGDLLPPGTTVPRPVRNVLANWTAYLMGFVVNFFISPLIVNHLGAEGYGVWTLLATVTAYLGLLDLGIRSAVTRYVARSESQGDRETATQIASAALVLLAVMGGLALAAAVLLGLAAPSLFHIPAGYGSTTLVVATLAGASTSLALVSGAFGGVLIGRQRFDLAGRIDVAATLVRAALVLAVVTQGGGLVALALVQFAASLTSSVATSWLALRIHPDLRGRPPWGRPHLRLIVSYGGYSFVAQIGASIVDRAGVILAGVFLPMTAVAVFAIASSLIDYARALVGGIRTTLAPQASALEGQGQRSALHDLTLRGVRYCSLLVLPIAITFALRGATFIGLWMGREYGAPSGEVLTILAVRLACLGATGASGNVMLGASRERAVAAVCVAEAAITVAAVQMLVGPFGLLGVAWGAAMPTVAAALLIWPPLLREAFGVEVRRYLSAGWGRPAAALLPFGVATWLVEDLWPPLSLLLFVAQVSMLLPLALLGIWYVGLSNDERRECLELVVRRRAVTGPRSRRTPAADG